METLEIKINTSELKSVIKELAEKQKFYRNQRKEVHILGERKLPANEASGNHRYNRYNLRIMYAAYGLMKGKTFSEIENNYPEENHPLNMYKYDIDKLVKKYSVAAE